jgi:hypothetical protein
MRSPYMKRIEGIVVDGRVVPEGDVLPEGQTVVLVDHPEGGPFEVSPELVAALRPVVMAFARGDEAVGERLLEELRQRGI